MKLIFTTELFVTAFVVLYSIILSMIICYTKYEKALNDNTYFNKYCKIIRTDKSKIRNKVFLN